MKLTIDKSKWYRGILTGSSLVRVADNKMCCLGFLGIAFGGDPTIEAGKEGILEQAMPEKNQEFWPRWLFDHFRGDKNVSMALANINDNPYIIDHVRELDIQSIMKKYGDIDVEFIDGENPPISPI